MIHVRRAAAAFSLVEVTLALGIAAVCLLGVFALLPGGLRSNQNAAGDAAASTIVAAVVADLRATPSNVPASAQYAITFGAAKTIYFDEAGASSAAPTASSRYQVNITFPPNSSGASAAQFADVKISWPAAAAPANAVGSAEVFAAFSR